MKIGDAFLMRAAPRFIPHLYIVISDPQKGNFVIVNITGDRFRAGKECVLEVGDHPWIKKQSFVSFADALEITPKEANRINKLIAQKKAKMEQPLPPETLQKIVKAAKESSAIPENLKQLF